MEGNACGDVDVEPQKRRINGPCDKCGAKSFSSSRSRLLCKVCFVESVDHQFRKGLQAVKPSARHGGALTKLLVGFSGGFCSMALLDLCEKLVRQDARKVHFELHAVWVDCLDVLPCADAANVRQQIAALIRESSLFKSFQIIPLCAAFSSKLEPAHEETHFLRVLSKIGLFLCVSSVFVVVKAKLHRVFSGSRRLEVTWKEDLQNVLVRALLLRAAQGKNCCRIVIGESMTRCCVNLLTGKHNCLPCCIWFFKGRKKKACLAE
jgi:hypothetical protein